MTYKTDKEILLKEYPSMPPQLKPYTGLVQEPSLHKTFISILKDLIFLPQKPALL